MLSNNLKISSIIAQWLELILPKGFGFGSVEIFNAAQIILF